MNSVYERESQIAAFFDLDGTLLAGPSLERQFFAMLRSRGAVSASGYIAWLARAVKLAPEGIHAIAHANKRYLRGVDAPGLVGAKRVAPQCDTAIARADRTPVLRFHARALDRMAWHAKQNHRIFLVSGTLAPLAQVAGIALLMRLAAQDVSASIGVCATQLEEVDGQWTGRIVGEAVCGPAKRRLVEQLAQEQGFDLAKSYAYGDTMNDRWLLAAVGRPAVVNPSKKLRRLAGLYDWPVHWWGNRAPSGKRREGGDPGSLASSAGAANAAPDAAEFSAGQ